MTEEEVKRERLAVFAPVKTAGLHPGELAMLLNIHRVTASLWLTGRKSPHHLIRDRVESFLRAVEAAVAAGDLPLSPDIPRRERAHHLRKVLASRV